MRALNLDATIVPCANTERAHPKFVKGIIFDGCSTHHAFFFENLHSSMHADFIRATDVRWLER